MFQKEDLFPSSGEGLELPTLVGPLERANLNHLWQYNYSCVALPIGPNWVGVSHPLSEGKNMFSFEPIMFRIQDEGYSPKIQQSQVLYIIVRIP
jgi:hypothetical protein